MLRDLKEAKAMSSRSYHVPPAGHPGQTELLTGRAVFTEAYAVIPKGVIRDIVASYLPHWAHTRVWVLARPLSGFAETFSHYLVALSAAGGFAYTPPGSSWSVRHRGASAEHFHWLRKPYQRVPDLALADPIVTNEAD